MYKINLKINEQFKCRAKLDGIFPRNLKPRLVFESAGNVGVICTGTIDNITGECSIPLTGLRQYLKEGCIGKMRLEMIVGDTYYNPWQDAFECAKTKSSPAIAEQNAAKIKPRPVVKNDKGRAANENDLSFSKILKNIKNK